MESPVIEGLVSTIIPVFNRPRMLEESVASVLAQTYRPIEIIIVDDGSSDETADVADRLAAENRDEIVALHVENRGPGLAREAGLERARGEFIQYLDSDDLLLPEKFWLQVEALQERPDCGIAYGMTRLVDANGQVLAAPYKWSGRALEFLFPALLVDRWWNTHTPLYRRSLCEAIGPWTDMQMGEDWEYDARAGALGTRLVWCPSYVSHTRAHSNTRLTEGPLSAPETRDLVRLHRRLFDCARQAGISLATPEMRHFSRSAFRAARQAGAAGLHRDAKAAFELALEATEPARRQRPSLLLYRLLSRLVGWRLAGHLSQAAYRLSGRRPGSETLEKPSDEIPSQGARSSSGRVRR